VISCVLNREYNPFLNTIQNLSVHRSKWMRIIERRGCQLWLLPSYSPYFNPIEEAFSEPRNLLRKAKARTLRELLEATAEALEAMSAGEARGYYFEHCGYRTPKDHSL
jgi:transposase